MDLNTSSGSSWTSVPHTASQNSSSIWIMTIKVTQHSAILNIILDFCHITIVIIVFCTLPMWTYECATTSLHFCVFVFTSYNIHTAGRLQFMLINLVLWDHPSMLECEGKHFPVNSGGGSSTGVVLYYEGQILLYSIQTVNVRARRLRGHGLKKRFKKKQICIFNNCTYFVLT